MRRRDGGFSREKETCEQENNEDQGEEDVRRFHEGSWSEEKMLLS